VKDVVRLKNGQFDLRLKKQASKQSGLSDILEETLPETKTINPGACK
jgi:hypothetical protein